MVRSGPTFLVRLHPDDSFLCVLDYRFCHQLEIASMIVFSVVLRFSCSVDHPLIPLQPSYYQPIEPHVRWLKYYRPTGTTVPACTSTVRQIRPCGGHAGNCGVHDGLEAFRVLRDSTTRKAVLTLPRPGTR